MTGGKNKTSSVGLAITLLLAASTPALAQQTSGSNYLQTAPLYNFGANPYSLATPPAQTSPPGSLALTPSIPSPASNLATYAQHVHGFVAAGVSSHGGDNLAAGVLLPLVPGKADLALAATTGEFGDLPHPPGTKSAIARYNSYQATLRYHPSDDFEAEIGVSRTSVRGANLSPVGPVP